MFNHVNDYDNKKMCKYNDILQKLNVMVQHIVTPL